MVELTALVFRDRLQEAPAHPLVVLVHRTNASHRSQRCRRHARVAALSGAALGRQPQPAASVLRPDLGQLRTFPNSADARSSGPFLALGSDARRAARRAPSPTWMPARRASDISPASRNRCLDAGVQNRCRPTTGDASAIGPPGPPLPDDDSGAVQEFWASSDAPAFQALGHRYADPRPIPDPFQTHPSAPRGSLDCVGPFVVPLDACAHSATAVWGPGSLLGVRKDVATQVPEELQ